MIIQKDSLAFLEEQKDFAFDINYSDPPYALGSEVYIRPDGKFDYKKATDFMNKWEMPTGDYWEKWFEESLRTLKHGGYCVMFGIDRQLPMFQYYAIKAGFQVRQSMYWYFISSFPKASDLSKNLDKNAKADRVVVGKQKHSSPKADNKMKENSYGISGGKLANGTSAERFHQDITAPATDLAKKYEGYKYSIAPLKQTVETIMVFQKPYKTGSCLHDTLAYENGDETCACFAWNIDGGRVGLTELDDPRLGGKGSWKTDKSAKNVYEGGYAGNDIESSQLGRYPSQTFCDSGIAERLDEQSGSSKSAGGTGDASKGKKGVLGFEGKANGGFGDIGGCSKILHKCDYENGEMDLYVYAPKVSKTERNAGCDDLEEKAGGIANDSGRSYKTKCSICEKEIRKDGRKNACECEEPQEYYPEVSQKNNHPTLKPISLSYRLLTLFKTPNPQKIVYPFAGVQSEVIGGYKAGFTDFLGCELNAEYIDIGNIRFEHWKDKPFDEKGKVVEPKKETKAKAKKEVKPIKKPNEQLKLL
jgi:site-specific DNA-methyltransferase (adenine-specific)